MWVDEVHFNIRLEEDRLCCLVVVGVRPDGTKELIALADGYRESTESWVEVLRGLKDRGLSAPVLAVGDGALGFWAALCDVFPPPECSASGCASRLTLSTPSCPGLPRPWRRQYSGVNRRPASDRHQTDDSSRLKVLPDRRPRA